MGISINSVGKANATSHVNSGNVDKGDSWSFSAADGNALLGANGDDWSNYAKWFLGVDMSATEKTKARYHYPFGKNGKVYRSGVIAAKQRAAQQGDTAVEDAASALLSKIDGKGMQRAWSRLVVKMVSEGARLLEGVATTPSTDRMGDVVMPQGAKFKLPIPLLWQHDSAQPVGEVTACKVTKDGITCEMKIATVAEAGALRDRLDMVWQTLKAGLVKGLSIGFNPMDVSPIKGTYGYQFDSWEFLELSLVTIPANADASITMIKKIDREVLAASGTSASGRPPGVSGTLARKGITQRQKGTEMKTLHELRAERQQKVDRLNELKGIWEAGQDPTDDETTEADGLVEEVKALDADIRRAQIDSFNISRATEVDARSFASGAQARAGKSSQIIVRKTDPDDKFKGQSFVRMAIAQGLASLQRGVKASEVAEMRWGKTNPTLVAVIKANEIAGGSSLVSGFASELVQANTMYTGDFIEFLYAMTVFDKLNLREVPANVVIKGQDGTGTGYWVGQGKAIPASKEHFTSVTLSPLKVAAISVVTNELLRDSTPAAEALIRDSLAQASAQRIDTTFLSTLAAVSNVSPAGILHGLSAVPSTGEDATALRADVLSLYAPFIAANNASDLVYVTTPSVAKAISLMISTLGVPLFPGLGANGGTLLGDPVVTGNNVPARALILLKPTDIYEIGDLGIQVSVSQEAMIEQSSAPIADTVTPTAATQAFTSMFQEESTAFKVVRPINFALRRATAVSYMSDAAYGLAST